MSAPRFQKGQMVVMHGFRRDIEWNGHVGEVREIGWLPWAGGWVYRVTGDPDPKFAAEKNLRPYDPPSTWDHEDSVWQPESLKNPKEVC